MMMNMDVKKHKQTYKRPLKLFVTLRAFSLKILEFQDMPKVVKKCRHANLFGVDEK